MAALLATALLFRVGIFIYALRYMPASSDEAWPSLMAMHILKGEFPVVYWGQSYMGTQESYFQALLMALFGPHIGVMRIYPFLFGLGFVAVTVALARRIYGPQVGWITLALLAVPVPYLAMCGAMIAPDNYLALTVLGSLALLIVHNLVTDESGRHRYLQFAFLGFLLGYTFWLHILVFSYIGVAALFLFLHDKKILFRGEAWCAAAAFVIGALPLLLYNLANGWGTFGDVGQTLPFRQRIGNVEKLFIITLHFLTGMKVMFTGDKQYHVNLPQILSVAVGVITLGAVGTVIVTRFKSFLRLVRLSVRPWDGTVMLVAMAGAAMFVCVSSRRYGWHDVRYVMPIISVLPILVAAGLGWVFQRSRILFGILLGTLLVVQVWGNVLLMRGWREPHVIAEALKLPDTGRVVARLDELGIRHAYAHFWLSYRMTYQTRERIIVSEPYNERFPFRYNQVQYLDAVRAAPKVAHIWHPTMAFCRGTFDESLRKAGISFRREEIPPFTIYYDYRPPYGDAVLREVPKGEWKIAASVNEGLIDRARDGRTDTCWNTGMPQMSNMWVQVELQAPRPVAKIDVSLGKWVMDFPRGLQVDVSMDGTTWQTVRSPKSVGGMSYWEGTHPRFLVYGDYFTLTFPATPARFVRMTLTESHPKFCWSIAELRIHAAE